MKKTVGGLGTQKKKKFVILKVPSKKKEKTKEAPLAKELSKIKKIKQPLVNIYSPTKIHHHACVPVHQCCLPFFLGGRLPSTQPATEKDLDKGNYMIILRSFSESTGVHESRPLRVTVGV